MQFDIDIESIRTPALSLEYHLVPWDTEIIGKPVAQIRELQVFDPAGAARDYQTFVAWRERHGVQLCSCRVPADRLVDSMFLEAQDFRFIELNYLPRLADLQARQFAETNIAIAPADETDREQLADMAGQVLRHGRFHHDPRIDPALGDKRYRTWMTNAFTRPQQQTLKCLLDGAIVGFFVVERPAVDHCFWSLVGLAPGLQGQGLGKRVWNAMLRRHRNMGVQIVSTSISSLNIAVFNLYVSLDFRFPAPSMTLQWTPPGLHVAAR